MSITFKKASFEHRDEVLRWLDEPHVREFWDNSPEHRADLDIFINGRKVPSPYFDGIFYYWIGLKNDQPFCLIMSAGVSVESNVPELWKANLSQSGNTISLDFLIGEITFLGQGLADKTLKAFVSFYQKDIDCRTDTFLIDPDINNPKAQRVYEKAGFIKSGSFIANAGIFVGNETVLLVKNVDNHKF